MGGLCLGMSRAEIERKTDGIIEFSELASVIDQPFRTYSTGMQARLTFATAISVDPDILIIDEALSVGDAKFQMKCFARIMDLRNRNKTILLVSHDTNTITTFCDRALILENGCVFAEGDTKEMTVRYHNLLFGNGRNAPPVDRGIVEGLMRVDSHDIGPAPFGDAVTTVSASLRAAGPRYGTGEARLLDWGLLDAQGQRQSLVESGTAFRLSMVLLVERDVHDLSVGFAIKDRRGTVVWGVTNISQSLSRCRARAGETLRISVDGAMWLAAGDYFVTLGAAHLDEGTKIDFIEDAIEFRVVGPHGIFTTSVVNLQTVFRIISDAREEDRLGEGSG
jgi:hypothetical protein